MNCVREKRMQLGMKQTDLLTLLREKDPRLDIGTLSRIENDICLPPAPVLDALEEILQTPRDELFDGLEIFLIEADNTPAKDITFRIANTVPEGKKNAISRQELAEKLGVSDRKMREWVEKAKADGLLVNNDQDGVGYYQPTEPEELQRQYRQTYNRAMSMLVQLKYMRARMRA